ncbi:AMP-binding protein [Streptomyces sp. NPDC059783]|uniref:AMP-binding protein n=1 Tax=Streptomyces sp. NPDC059783 TaxID=3346944 RepID=UPI003668C9E4
MSTTLRLRGPDRALRRPHPLDLGETVAGRVHRQALSTPGRTAVLDGGTAVGYAALDAAVRRHGAALRAAGCAPGEPVLVRGPRSATAIAVFLAMEDLGCVHVPLDPGWSEERVAEVARHSGATRLVRYGPPGPPPPAPLRLVALGEEPGATSDAPAPRARAGAAEPRYALYTAEFTGGAEGAVTAHAGMVNHLWAKVTDLGLTGEDRVAYSAPQVFDTAVWQMLAPLLTGGTVAVVGEADTAFPRRLAGALDRTGTTVVELVPTAIGWLLDRVEKTSGREPGRQAGTESAPGPAPESPPESAPEPVGALRLLVATGGELSPALASRIAAVLPGVTTVFANGPVECSDDVLHHRVGPGDLSAPRVPRGRPIPNAVLSAVLPEPDGAWRHAGPGEIGELLVQGAPVGLGHLRDGTVRTGAYLRDTTPDAGPSGLAFRTGDLVSFHPGEVRYHGRTDRQLLYGGRRLALEELEGELRRHPGVRQCAVLAGERDGVPELTVFYTAADPGAPPDGLGRAPGHPDLRLRWTRRTVLPLTRKGEIDHRALSCAPDPS